MEKFNNGLNELQKLILDKRFEVSKNVGYEPEDVDQFFDDVKSYIKEVNDEVKSLFDKKEAMRNKLGEYEEKIRCLTSDIQSLTKDIEYYKNEGYGSFRSHEENSGIVKDLKKDIEDLKRINTELLQRSGLKNDNDKKN
jgi:cell division septum initiation protein DivIVA